MNLYAPLFPRGFAPGTGFAPGAGLARRGRLIRGIARLGLLWAGATMLAGASGEIRHPAIAGAILITWLALMAAALGSRRSFRAPLTRQDTLLASVAAGVSVSVGIAGDIVVAEPRNERLLYPISCYSWRIFR